MTPPIALALTLLLIGYLMRHDLRRRSRVSSAVWIPICWLMINSSRQVSQWVTGQTGLSAQALSEGNAIDKVVYSGLIIVGIVVLARRKIQIAEIAKNNIVVVLFLLYAGLSVFWSDYPLTSMKRWIKALGDPVMVLVLWTEPSPVRAITAAMRRCAYVLIPLSVLFCKYYEHLGRAFDAWGKASYTGVTTDKNMFGYLLFVYGLYFFAALMAKRDVNPGSSRLEANHVRIDFFINMLMLSMIGWLLPIANSKTATLSLLAGAAVVVALRFDSVRRHFWPYACLFVLLVTAGEMLFSVQSAVLDASGRDATFTGRTGLWETVLNEPINPIIGAGYSSFWLGERLVRFWAMYPTSPPIQAHNGYIEVYLNLGLIGLGLMIAMLWRGLRRMQSRAIAYSDPHQSTTHSERTLGIFGLAFGTAYLLYNVTEATFQPLNPLFIMFLIMGFQYSSKSVASRAFPNAVRRPVRRRGARPRAIGRARERQWRS